MTCVYISLGSNLDDPKQQITSAFNHLCTIKHTELVAQSSLYLSEPLGEPGQPDYINAVAALKTRLPAEKFLDELQQIELAHHRQRSSQRWVARTLDLDILLYGDAVISSQRLVVPHYQMTQRNFVLVPLMEIAPHLRFPDGTSLVELPLAHNMSGLKRLKQP